MTLEEYKRENPGFVFTKENKQWDGCDIYEVSYNSTSNEPMTGPPMYILVAGDGSAESVEDELVALSINKFLRSK